MTKSNFKKVIVSLACAATAAVAITGECHLIKRSVNLNKQRHEILAEYKASQEFEIAHANALEDNEIAYKTSNETDFAKRYNKYISSKDYINSNQFVEASIVNSSYASRYNSCDKSYLITAPTTAVCSFVLIPAAIISSISSVSNLIPDKDNIKAANKQPEKTM